MHQQRKHTAIGSNDNVNFRSSKMIISKLLCLLPNISSVIFSRRSQRSSIHNEYFFAGFAPLRSLREIIRFYTRLRPKIHVIGGIKKEPRSIYHRELNEKKVNQHPLRSILGLKVQVFSTTYKPRYCLVQ